MEGRKDDQIKIRYELLPPELEAAVATVLTANVQNGKYEARNWEQGTQWSRYYAALRRHMAAWWSGEDNDPDTHMPHLWHAACCISFLIAYDMRSIGEDDRPEANVPRMSTLEAMVQDALRNFVPAPLTEKLKAAMEDDPEFRGPLPRFGRGKPNFGPAAEENEG